MAVAIIYLILVAIAFFGTNGTYLPNTTHVLMAAGIIGVCSALHDIEKKI